MSALAARSRAKAASLASSPHMEADRFSSISTVAGPRRRRGACLTGSPTQSSTKVTGWPSSSASRAPTGARLISGTRLPLGRSKCASRATAWPLRREGGSRVGRAARSRVSSVTRPALIGTLKSTRTRARAPRAWLRRACASPWVSPEVIAAAASAGRAASAEGGLGHPRRKAPLVVVPGEHPCQGPVDHLRLGQRHGRGGVDMVHVDRDHGVAGDMEDAAERILLTGAGHRLVDLRRGDLAAGNDLEVDHRDVGRGHADRGAVELSGQLRQHEAERLGRAGGGGDHRHAGGAGAVEILVQGVQRGLVAGVGVDRGHVAALDPGEVEKHLGYRRQAVGRAARAVRDDKILSRERPLVHPHHDRLVGSVAGRRHQHLAGAGGEVGARLFL